MGVPTRVAMRLMLLVFMRTSELIETPWAEIDLAKGEWIIPWKRMKRGKRRINPDKTDHRVCLSRQALGMLRDLHRHTGGGDDRAQLMKKYGAATSSELVRTVAWGPSGPPTG